MMSWMDSWSRPSKTQATPPPLYLLPGGEATPYCRTCGRVISSRKVNATSDGASQVKYCSTRCRNNKPGKIDRQIEDTFVALLNKTENDPGLATANILAPTKKDKRQRKPKGETRITVPCSLVENLTFGDRNDLNNVFGRRKNRAKRGKADDLEWRTVDMEDDLNSECTNMEEDSIIDGDVLAQISIRTGSRIRPAQDVSEVNGSVGGEKGWAERIEETEEMLKKRKEGQRRAAEKESVRSAARRGVVFGFVVQDAQDNVSEQRRKCEAVMLGNVVESSFAKGEWGIRWRE